MHGINRAGSAPYRQVAGLSGKRDRTRKPTDSSKIPNNNSAAIENPMDTFLQRVSCIPVLTRDHEVEIFKGIKGAYLDNYKSLEVKDFYYKQNQFSKGQSILLLCEAINSDRAGLKLEKLYRKFSDNEKEIFEETKGPIFTKSNTSINGLNKFLRDPNLYTKLGLVEKSGDKNLDFLSEVKRELLRTRYFRELIIRTREILQKDFNWLTKEEQKLLLHFNRLILDTIYSLHSPPYQNSIIIQNRNKTIIEHNLRLVASRLKGKIKDPSLFKDWLEEGVSGLNKAINRFDYERGNKFSTYASWWIRQSIRRAQQNKRRTIRIPIHAQEKSTKMNRIQQKLAQILMRQPTIEDMSIAFGQDVSETSRQLEQSITENSSLISLDQPINDEFGDRTLVEIIEDPDSLNQEDLAIDRNSFLYIKKAISTLRPNEQKVLRLRFGFKEDNFERDQNHPDGLTLEKVGEIMKLTRERIRQIQNQALQKVRARMESPFLVSLN